MEIVSIIIAVIALGVSIFSVYENRKHIRLSQEPYIVSHETESEARYSYEITNKGGGPAYFKKVEYFVGNKPLKEKNLREALTEILHQNDIKFKSSIVNMDDESIMAPGETFILATIEIAKEDAPKLQSMPDGMIGIRIKYSCAHGKEKTWCSNDELEHI